MTIRNLMLQVAEHLEQHPELFKFTSLEVPDLKSSGCIIGWICYFAGQRPGAVIRPSLVEGLESDTDIYSRLSTIDPYWTLDAPKCTKALHTYIDKYYPEVIQ